MKHNDIIKGLKQLGHHTGWVITGDEITSWENDTPQPTEQALTKAVTLWEKSEADKQAKAEADKSALLAKLGITADEAKLLLL
jgi:hypothetical protein